jgi:hypothetical protein
MHTFLLCQKKSPSLPSNQIRVAEVKGFHFGLFILCDMKYLQHLSALFRLIGAKYDPTYSTHYFVQQLMVPTTVQIAHTRTLYFRHEATASYPYFITLLSVRF